MVAQLGSARLMLARRLPTISTRRSKCRKAAGEVQYWTHVYAEQVDRHLRRRGVMRAIGRLYSDLQTVPRSYTVCAGGQRCVDGYSVFQLEVAPAAIARATDGSCPCCCTCGGAKVKALVLAAGRGATNRVSDSRGPHVSA